MSTLVTNNMQIGQSSDPLKNFTLRQPSVPDGSLILSRGNQANPGATILTVNPQGAILLPDGTAVGGNGLRNKVINGNKRVNQRAVVSTTADQQFVWDRWMALIGVAGITCTVGNNSVNNPSITGGGGTYVQNGTSVKAALAAGDYLGLQHRIEGYNIADLLWGSSSAKQAVASFRAYASQATTIGVSVRNSAADRSLVVPVALSAGYGSYAVPVPGCTDGTWNNGNGIGASLNFSGAAGANFTTATANAWQAGNYLSHSSCSNICDTASRYFVISDVQFEQSTFATPFNWQEYSDELRRCLRYFQIFAATTSGRLLINPMPTYTSRFVLPRLPVEMRAAPTVIPYNTAGTVNTLTEFSSDTTYTVSTVNEITTWGEGWVQTATSPTTALRWRASYNAEI